MCGHLRGTLALVGIILAGVALPRVTAAQGTNAFPLLAYQPVAPESPLANPASWTDNDATALIQDGVKYRRHPLIGAAFGAIIGAAAGYVAGGDASDRTRGEQALIGAAVGAGIGLVVGYFIKTPVIEESALGHVIPEQLAFVPASGGGAVQVGWSSRW